MNRLLKDKRGSSLAMVLATMSFMTILGVTVIMLTLTNVNMKYTQKNSQVEFYNADGMMDLIEAGLENDSEKVASYAYSKALTDYSDVVTGKKSTSLDDLYVKYYLQYMIYNLVGFNVNYAVNYNIDSSDYNKPYDETKQKKSSIQKGIYDDGITEAVVDDYLNQFYAAVDSETPTTSAPTSLLHYHDSRIANYLGKYAYFPNNSANGDYPSLTTNYFINHLETKDNYIKLTKEDGQYFITLMNVRVASPESSEYYTSITADLKLPVPNANVEVNKEYVDYAIIADDQILVDDDATVNGNVYAGTVNRVDDTGKASSNVDCLSGILVGNTGDGVTLNLNSKQVITRGDLAVRNNSNFNIQGEGSISATVWAENIKTERKVNHETGNTIYIDAKTYIADDFDLNSKNDSAVLKGSYFGYNYKDLNDSASTTNDAKFSSTISINGTNNNLNISDLTRLLLAGKSFISKPSNEYATGEAKAADIGFTESLTSKSNQLAYYIPDEFICEPGDVDGDGNDLYLSWNSPLEFSVSGTNGYYFDVEGYSNKYAGFDVSSFLLASNPVSSYYRNKAGIQGSNGEVTSVQYYYLNVDPDSATNYYTTYSTVDLTEPDAADTSEAAENKRKIIALRQQYESVSTAIGSISEPGAGCLITSAGNILYNSGTTTNIVIGNATTEDGSALQTYSQTMNKYYMSRQMSLLSEYSKSASSSQYRLYNDYSEEDKGADAFNKSGRTDSGVKDTNLFDVLLDRSKLTDTTKTGIMVDVDGDGTAETETFYIVSTASTGYTYDGSSPNGVGVIIATGDVKVERDFSGLIISGGDVILKSNNVKINASADAVKGLFDADGEEMDPVITNLFREYFRGSVSNKIESKDAANKNVIVENWVKNKLDR